MTYNPNIPQAGDNPVVSQGQLLNNFSILNSDFAVNHIALTSGANPGLHTMINFATTLAADPNLAVPQTSLYPKSVAGNPQLFFQNGALAANVVQLTGLVIANSGTDWGFTTPWGWVVNMGSALQSFTGSITFAVQFRVGFTPYTFQIAPKTISVVNANSIETVTNTKMTYTSTSDIYYLAIGST
jgi:hypothetical protein